uniref:DUF4219 domain-containing protein n=1 Tax=Oryza sativa subsp. japonica TaxID=39947 RepID=Q84TT0_ORYSJ|nr:hypothetical protein [Oryza sativa Japonica Group]
MSNEVNHVGKAPMFNGTNYSTWKIKMSTHLKAMSFHIWMSNLETAYDIWNKLAEIHEGTSEYKDAQLHFLKIQYETFSMLPHESVNDMYGRLNVIVNDLKGLGANYTDLEVAQKMLRALPENLLGKINTNDMYKLKKKEMEEASPSKKCIALQTEVEDKSKGKVNEGGVRWLRG